jgi:diguanylate cyclase (GGDEF)-like protein
VHTIFSRLLGKPYATTGPSEASSQGSVLQTGNKVEPELEQMMQNETMSDSIFNEQSNPAGQGDSITHGTETGDMGASGSPDTADLVPENPAISDLQTAAREFNAAFDTALYELESSRKLIAERTARINELNESIAGIRAALDEEIGKRQEQEASHSRETGELRRRVEAAATEREHLQQQAEEQEQALDARRAEILELTNRVTELDYSIEQVSTDRQLAQEEFTQEKERLSARLSELQSSLESAESELQARQAELHDRDGIIAGLREQYDNSVRALDERQLELQQRDDTITGLHAQADSLSADIDARQFEISALKDQFHALRDQYDNSTQTLEERQRELQQRDETIAGLQSRADSLATELDASMQEVSGLNDRIGHLTAELQTLSGTLQAETASHEHTRMELDEEIRGITGEIESLRSYNEDLGAHAGKLEQLNQALHESSVSENSVHKKALQEKTREITRLRELLDAHGSAEVEQAVNSAEIEQLQQHIRQLGDELEMARHRHQSLEEAARSAAQLETEVETLHTALEDARNANAGATADAGALAEMQERLARLESELHESRAEVEALTVRLQEQNRLEQEVMSMRETSMQSASSSATIAALKEEVAGLQAALQNAEQDLTQLRMSGMSPAAGEESDRSGEPDYAAAPDTSSIISRAGFIAGLDKLLTGDHTAADGNSIVYMMLDNIASIRDDIGIMASENMIDEVAEIVASLCGSGDRLTRYGDNTFVLLCRNEEYKASQEKAEQVRSTIENRMFLHSGNSQSTTMSIGICSVRDNDSNAEALVARAELACQLARSSGGNQVLASSAIADQMAMQGNNENNEEMVTRTLKEDRIRIYYQPITSLKGHERNHFEVLTRIVDEGGNTILPGEFFAMAENSGHAVDIDMHVIEDIMRMMSENRNLEMTLFIKLTRQSVSDHDVPVWILDKVNEYRINPEQLVFEVSEHVMQSNLKHLSMLSKALQAIGCKVAIEHYRMATPPQHLQQVKADYLKIDSSLAGNVSSKGDSLSKVRDIVTLAKQHNYFTVAEGVESPASLAILWELGVNLAQGYFIQAPASELNYDFHDNESESGHAESRKATFTIS